MSQSGGTPDDSVGSAMSGEASIPTLPIPADGDHDIGYRIGIAATVTCVAAALIVLLRFKARISYARLGWDDYFMFGALVLTVVANIIDFVATHWGLGRHLYYLDPEQRVNQQFYSLLSHAVFGIHSLTLCKISISLTFVRILKGSFNRCLKLVCYAIAISVLIVNTMVMIFNYTQCIPSEKSWNPSVHGTCYDRKVFMGFVLLQGSFSAFTDLALCIIPILLLRDLQVDRRSKSILVMIVTLGLITAIFGIIRTYQSSQSLKIKVPDLSYTSVSGLVWASMERNIAILLGSIPQCRPLVVPISNYTKAIWSHITGKRYATPKGPSEGQGYAMNETIGSKPAPGLSNHSDMADKRAKTSTVPSIPSQDDILPNYQMHQVV